MTYNEALVRNAFLNELSAVSDLKAKAMTERILLSIHYRKAADEWLKIREAIIGDNNASDEVKNEAVKAKVQEDCGLEARKMTREAFEQVVEAMLPIGGIKSFLGATADEKNEFLRVPAPIWLQAFAEIFVE